MSTPALDPERPLTLPVVDTVRVDRWLVRCGCLILFTVAANASLLRAQDKAPVQDDPVAINLHTIGNSAYESKDYAVAIEQWSKLLADFPGYSARLDIKYLIGQAWFQQAKYEEAAREFRELLQSIPVIKQFRSGPALLVFCGFSEYSMARTLEDPDAATALLEQAISRYEDFFATFPDDDLMDQARYFHGLAALHRNELAASPEHLDGAEGSFQAVIKDHPDSPLVPKAMHELGTCLELAGKYDEALKLYQGFAARFAEHELAPSMALRTAEAQFRLGQSRQNSGDTDAAKQFFSDAIKGFDALANTTGFPDQDLALFCKAECLQGMSELEGAAEALAELATRFPQSRFAGEAMLNAGKFFFAADQFDKAAEWLARSHREFAPGKDEAAHWLCRIHLQKKEYDQALELATQSTANGGGGKFRGMLLLDAGDALHEMPGRRKDAIVAYRELAESLPDDPVAARALYYAACACLAEGDLEGAVRDAEQFRKKYPDHELLPVTIEVAGEAALKSGKHEAAEAAFSDLVKRFPEHEAHSRWQSRLAWALSLQNKGTDAIALMEKELATLTDKAERAERYYIIGSTWFQQKEYAQAATAFENALRENPERPDANLIRLLLARASHEMGNYERAAEFAQATLANEPTATQAAEAHYRLAEAAYENEDLEKAIGYYTSVIDAGDKNEFRANALYGRAWAHQGRGNHEDAVRDFSTLLADHSASPVASQALRGRAVARRNAGQTGEALEDIDAYLATNPAEEDLWQARYERGLCLAFLEKWSEAIAELEPLATQIKPGSEVADNLLYELAWAYRKNGDPEKATATFLSLAERYPESRFVAEARFHVGESHYEARDYAAASQEYEKCLALKPDANIGERAAFKRAWSAFEQEQWAEAHRLFQEQVERYPDGPLHAVGLSMVAESLFHDKKYSEAVTAYKVALPAITDAKVSDESVRILTPLHAAQSANKTGDFETARMVAEQLIRDFPDSGYQYLARFELGTALDGLGKADEAIAAWQPAAEKSIDKVGARARAMIGEAYFRKKDYKEAINQFKLVIYGYATTDQQADIDPWRAFSAYEAARCYYVRIKDASGEERPQLVADAKFWFQYLIDHYPNDALAGDARKQLEALNNIK